MHVVDDDASPRGGTHLALWEPPLLAGGGEHGAPTRRSAIAETGELLADLVADRTRTLAFVPSRRGVEAVAGTARRHLEEVDPGLANRVAGYRGGYLPEERRALEADLREGRLLGLATTSALELGIDVAGLDAVVVCGWPGRRSSLWQQVGRAGRRGRDALAVLVARDDPLDTFLVHHPEAIFGRDVEATVLDPTNPYVLAPHLCAAAAELPLTVEDLDCSAARRDPCWTRSSDAARCAGAPAAGTGRARSVRPTSPTCAVGGRSRSGSWRRRPAASSAPSTGPRATTRHTRAPSTSIRARRGRSVTSTSTATSPPSSRPATRSSPRRAR